MPVHTVGKYVYRALTGCRLVGQLYGPDRLFWIDAYVALNPRTSPRLAVVLSATYLSSVPSQGCFNGTPPVVRLLAEKQRLLLSNPLLIREFVSPFPQRGCGCLKILIIKQSDKFIGNEIIIIFFSF